MSFMELSKNIFRKTFQFGCISAETSLTGPLHTECRGPQVGVIYGKTLLTVPIGTPSSPKHPLEGACPACPSLNAAAHNFSSFHFQKDPRPVLESPE